MSATVTDQQVIDVRRRTNDALSRLEALFDEADRVAATIRTTLDTEGQDDR